MLIRRGTARRLGLRRRYAATWHPMGYCSRCDRVHYEIELVDAQTGLIRDRLLQWVRPRP